MKTLAKNALCAFYKYSGLMFAQETVSGWTGKSFMAIVLLHRVTDQIPEDGLTVSTDWFRGFCRMLRSRFTTVPLREILQRLEHGQRPPRRMVAVTFDDCYRDNLVAARILAEHGLPATFFVPTGYVGTEHTFPWDNGLAPMPNLGWDDIREMVRLGHEIGSHTVSHPNMAEIPEAQARRELIESRQAIEEKIQRPVRYFAYPFGTKSNFPAERLPLVYEAGYQACFSGYGGFVHAGMLGRILPREPVPYFRSLLNLELHLCGCLDWMYALKRRAALQ